MSISKYLANIIQVSEHFSRYFITVAIMKLKNLVQYNSVKREIRGIVKMCVGYLYICYCMIRIWISDSPEDYVVIEMSF